MSGNVIVSDDPSPPDTLSATNTALGIVIVCATSGHVTSSTILPNCPFKSGAMGAIIWQMYILCALANFYYFSRVGG